MFNRLIIILITVAVLILQSPVLIAQETQEDVDKSNNNDKSNITETSEEPADIVIKDDESLSLNKCVNVALINNPEIKSAMSESDIFKARIGQAKAAYVPEFGLSGGYTYSNANSQISYVDFTSSTFDIATANLTQLIYDFGKTHTNIKIQKINYESSREDLQDTVNNVVYDVKKAYFNLLLAMENKYVHEESVKMYEAQLKQAEAFYKVGEKPKVDVLTAKVNLSNAKLALIKADNLIKIAYSSLNNVMGLTKTAQYKLADELTYSENKIAFDDIIQIAYENRPDYKSAVLKSDSAKSQIKLAKTEYFPRMEASTGYSVRGYNFSNQTNLDTGWNVGAHIKIPVLNIYRTKKRVDEARANYEKEIFDSEKLKNDIYLEVQQAYYIYVDAIESIPVSEVAMKEAKENYDLTNGRYNVGFGNYIELKDADLYYINAKLNYYKTLYEYNMAVAALEKNIGKDLSVK